MKELFFIILKFFKFFSFKSKLSLLISAVLISASAFVEMKMITLIIPLLTNQNSAIYPNNLLPSLYLWIPFLLLLKFGSVIFSNRSIYLAGVEIATLTHVGSTSLKFILFESNWILTNLVTFSNAVISALILPTVRFVSALITILILLYPYLIKLNFSYFVLLLFTILVCSFLLKNVVKFSSRNSKVIASYLEKSTYLAQSLSNVHLEYIVNGSPISTIIDYFKTQRKFRIHQFYNELITILPRTLLETLSIVGIVVPIIIGGPEMRFIILSFSVALVRLQPLFQQLYSSFANISSTIEETKSVMQIVSSINPKYVKYIYKNIYKKNQYINREVISADQKINLRNNYQLKESMELGDKITHQFNISKYQYLKSLKKLFELNFYKGFNFIIGNSGSGKSSLIKIMINDIFSNKNNNLKNSIFYLSQFPFLPPISVKDSILQYARNKSELNKIQLNIFNQFGFNENKLKQISTTLSGGELKRICILRAIFSSRPILILDEPFTGLPQDKAKEILDLIRKNITNKIVIIITHNLNDLKNSDHIINMNELIL